MFKTELHAHTAEVSTCATVPAEQFVEDYLKAGYTTVVLSNHLSRFTYKSIRYAFDHTDWPWEKKIDHYLAGYHKLLEAAGDRLNIILGCELRSNIDENDYLLYGVTEDFLYSIPNMMDEKIVDIRAALHKIDGLFFQAHPFRSCMRVTDPKYLDGVEVFNGTLYMDSNNELADLYADKYNLLKSSGSDYHGAPRYRINGGIETESPIVTSADLLKTLRNGNFTLIRGDRVSPPEA